MLAELAAMVELSFFQRLLVESVNFEIVVALLNWLNEKRDKISLFKINNVCQLKKCLFNSFSLLSVIQLFARILFH